LLARVAAMCSGAAKQADGGPASRASFDVARTVAQVRELIASTLPASVSLETDAQDPTPVVADAQDVFRILFNLLHNAATVARDGSLRAIRVTLARTGTMAVMTVSDDGPGVPAAVRSRLFLGGRSTTGGSGQGLAIARELAERNGGTLRLADTPHGATFVVELPLDMSAGDRVAMLFRERGASVARSPAA
jgi:signal transduction histidine kinase